MVSFFIITKEGIIRIELVIHQKFGNVSFFVTNKTGDLAAVQSREQIANVSEL